MRLVYKFNIGYNDALYELCKISKNLYNQSLYIVKKELKDNNKWLGYNQLNTIMQQTYNLDNEINYRLLKAQVSQQCLRQLDKNIKSYVKSIKDYSKNKSKYNGCPKFPKYKKEVNQLIYTNQCASIKNGYIRLSSDIHIKIPQYDKYMERLSKFQQIRINSQLDKTLECEIIYIDDSFSNVNLDKDKYASIDLGVDNLATLICDDNRPILYNGRQVKSKNQFFNKEISRLKSKLTNNKRSSKRIKRLWKHRDNQMNDIFHKLSRKIVNRLIENKVGNIVVGYNKGWKDSIQLSKKVNQTFVSIPYDKLINYLQYKCEMCGIEMTITEESYTSVCDALAMEEIGKHEEYKGKRKKRGLYQSSIGKLINADINGALNIMRKVVDDSEVITRIVNNGWLFQPLRVNIL